MNLLLEWIQHFRRGCMSTSESLHSGLPVETNTLEMFNAPTFKQDVRNQCAAIASSRIQRIIDVVSSMLMKLGRTIKKNQIYKSIRKHRLPAGSLDQKLVKPFLLTRTLWRLSVWNCLGIFANYDSCTLCIGIGGIQYQIAKKRPLLNNKKYVFHHDIAPILCTLDV